jgi:hypothetical protein
MGKPGILNANLASDGFAQDGASQRLRSHYRIGPAAGARADERIGDVWIARGRWPRPTAPPRKDSWLQALSRGLWRRLDRPGSPAGTDRVEDPRSCAN